MLRRFACVLNCAKYHPVHCSTVRSACECICFNKVLGILLRIGCTLTLCYTDRRCEIDLIARVQPWVSLDDHEHNEEPEVRSKTRYMVWRVRRGHVFVLLHTVLQTGHT